MSKSALAFQPIKAVVFAGLLWFPIALSSQGQPVSSVTLAWDASPGPDVAGYHLYYGPASHSYTIVLDVGNVTTKAVSNLMAGSTYYFSLTAYDTSGVESDFSNEVTYTPTNQVNVPLFTIRAIVAAPALSLQPGPSQLTLQWSSTAGSIYHVLYKSDLNSPGWTDLSGPIPGLGGMTSWSDSTAAGSPSRFYCVREGQ